VNASNVKKSVKYRVLCKKLDAQEMKDELDCGEDDELPKVSKPSKNLPDMDTLRRDMQNMTVKVCC